MFRMRFHNSINNVCSRPEMYSIIKNNSFTFSEKLGMTIKNLDSSYPFTEFTPHRSTSSGSASFWLSPFWRASHKNLKCSFNSQGWSKVAAKHNFCCYDLQENKVNQAKTTRSGHPRTLVCLSQHIHQM